MGPQDEVSDIGRAPGGASTAFLDFVTGGAMGLLVGSLIGLSTVPVVGAVITSITALVGAFLGLAASAIKQLPFVIQSWRIVGFGVLCVTGILAGIYLRTNDVLHRPLKPQIDELVGAGFDRAAVLELVAYRHFGIMPSGKTVQLNEVSRRSIAALFSYDSSVCTQLLRARSDSIQERLLALESGGDFFALMAERIRRRNVSEQDSLLRSVNIILCEIQ
jgi:hypothetical protein